MPRRPGRGGRTVLSVSQVAAKLKQWLEGLPPVWVKGEVSNLSRSPAGHMFFTLGDEGSVIDAILYRRSALVYGQFLEEGAELIVSGSVSFYAPGGKLQIVIATVEPVGAGAMREAFLRLKQKLEREGLFAPERKVPLPFLPRRIALLTSPSGAAVQDMISMIHERFPPVSLLVVPVRVQGDEAPFEIAKALHIADRRRMADVIIIGRGGGSAEDLAAFNTEVVVRAVADCVTPVVSAVGHEVDVSLTDLAADKRALTPTDAGKIVVPDIRDVLDDLSGATDRLAVALSGVLEDYVRRTDAAQRRLRASSPAARLREFHRRCLSAGGRLNKAASAVVRHKRSLLETRTEALEARSPLAVLSRGYSVTRRKGETAPLRDGSLAPAGSVLETILQKGRITSRVEESDGD